MQFDCCGYWTKERFLACARNHEQNKTLLLPLLGIAALNLFWLKPKLIDTASTPAKDTATLLKRLTRNLAMEAILGIGILLIGSKIVAVILRDIKSTEERLKMLEDALPSLDSAQVEIIVIRNLVDLLNVANRLPGLIVTEGFREIYETYKLFARSFSDESLVTGTRHVESLIDKQGYIRSRWLPAENEGWKNFDRLITQVELLRKERPRAPAPDEHVH